MKEVIMNGVTSMISVMEWIYDNNPDMTDMLDFVFDDRRHILVSKRTEYIWMFEDDIEESHLICGKFKMICTIPGLFYICKIRNNYYDMSV